MATLALSTRGSALRPKLWACLCATLVFLGCSASPLRPASPAPIGPNSGDAKLAHVLEEIRVKEGLPALASAIIVGGKIHSVAAVGTRQHGTSNWVTASDRFMIGSCAKAFTATLTGVLVEEGHLTWETTIRDVFPKIEMLPGYERITIEQLLSHRAGLPKNLGSGRNTWSIDYGFDDKRGSTPPSRRLQYLEKIVRRPLMNPPGKVVHYSNAGYILAGAMLEQISGKSYEKLREEKVFRPLGITKTGYGPPTNTERKTQPWGHYWDKSNRTFLVFDAEYPNFMAPAGYLNISLEGWAKFVLAHLSIHSIGNRYLLTSDTLRKLHTPPPLEIWDIDIGFDTNYALGWFTREIDDRHALIWHGVEGSPSTPRR